MAGLIPAPMRAESAGATPAAVTVLIVLRSAIGVPEFAPFDPVSAILTR
jgi:hypothetical protein